MSSHPSPLIGWRVASCVLRALSHFNIQHLCDVHGVFICNHFKFRISFKLLIWPSSVILIVTIYVETREICFCTIPFQKVLVDIKLLDSPLSIALAEAMFMHQIARTNQQSLLMSFLCSLCNSVDKFLHRARLFTKVTSKLDRTLAAFLLPVNVHCVVLKASLGENHFSTNITFQRYP